MKTILVVGLGNPGKKYERTRHNLGIRVVQAWVAESKELQVPTTDWQLQEKFLGDIATVSLPEARVVCLFPNTSMNKSGFAVAKAVKELYLSVEDAVIVQDEIELPFGEIDTRSGSAKGHNGVRSIQEALGTQDITRLRIGVGRPVDTTSIDTFVLSSFTDLEEETLQTGIIHNAVEQLSRVIGQRLLQE